MGIFSTIKEKIFGKSKKDAAPASPTVPTTPGKPAPTAAPAPVAVSEVDVAEQLDAMPGADRLNWRTSIVDLMKLIGIDSSFSNRKELAGELGDTDYSGTAEENIWLHRRTMQELAKNGGKVPAEFLD